MDKKKIILRADGGQHIGMGHFIRTLALAEMLKDDFHCIYATQKPTDYQINEIEINCEQWYSLPDDETHFNAFLNLLKGDEIVVLDNYYFTTDYQSAIKAKGCTLVCIDDMHDKHYVADMVINHAEGIDKNLFSKEMYTKLYLGNKYALLRKVFYGDNKINLPKEYSWFIMIGGADPYNLTHEILSFLKPQKQELPLAVVIGSDYENEEQLHSYSNINIFKGVKSEDVFQLMIKSRFGILPASTVSIEACAVRLPFICGFYIDNQKELYSGIKVNNLAVCIDNLLKVDPNEFLLAVDKINNTEIADKIKHTQMKLLDKKSKERFIKMFQEL